MLKVREEGEVRNDGHQAHEELNSGILKFGERESNDTVLPTVGEKYMTMTNAATALVEA
jgi:hypothetical protein